MKKLIFLMLLSLPAMAENSLEQFRIVEQGGSGLSTLSSGLSCFHDADNSVSMCVYTSDTSVTGMAPPNATTDKNSGDTTIHAENVWSGANPARTAQNLVLAGGLDSKTLLFDPGNPLTGGCAGTTQTLIVNGTTTTLTFNTICPAGCTTPALACAAYASWLTTNLTTVVASCGTITGGLGDALFVAAAQPATVSITWGTETAAACYTTSNGTDGRTILGQNDNSLIQFGRISTSPVIIPYGGAFYFRLNDGLTSANITANGATFGGLSCAGVTTSTSIASSSATSDIMSFDDWYDSTAMASDAAVTPQHVITGKPIYAGSVNPVNGTGGSIGLIPSPGEHSLEITNVANLAGDTLTFTTCLMELAPCDTTIITEGAGGGQVNCVGAGLNLAQCALAYKTLLDAHATLGPATVVTCTDATCSDAKFGIYVTPGTSSYLHVVYASGGSVGLTLADGQDGNVELGEPVGNGCVRVGKTFFASGTAVGELYIGSTCGGYTAPIDVGAVYSSSNIVASSGTVHTKTNTVLPQTITCATTGADATHSTCGGAQTITSNVVQTVCEDPDGCTLTLTETNFSATVAGNIVIHGPAANHVDLATSAGVLQLSAAFAMDTLDTLSLSYSPLLFWAEQARSVN